MQEIKRVIIPVDASDAAKIATEQGAYFAKLLNVDVSIISVDDSNKYMISAPLQDKFNKEREAVLKEVKEIAEKEGINVNTKLMSGSTGAAEEITKFANEDDLIVMASYGKEGYQKLFMGSVSEEVLRRSPCSVMVIKPR